MQQLPGSLFGHVFELSAVRTRAIRGAQRVWGEVDPVLSARVYFPQFVSRLAGPDEHQSSRLSSG
jgi:hypothetical protein